MIGRCVVVQIVIVDCMEELLVGWRGRGRDVIPLEWHRLICVIQEGRKDLLG